MTAFTAAMLESDPLAAVAIESSHCKLFGTTRAWDAIYDAMQVAGGSGYLTTQPYEKRMRDFRVTTIFEGTTEIHSIYPALFVLRALTKRLQASAMGRVSQLALLFQQTFCRARWPLAFNQKIAKRAARFAKSSARRIRLMIVIGLLFHGRSLRRKEFFLRRITTLSVYLYGIISVLAGLEAAQRSGRSIKSEIAVLAYFLEEARQVQRLNRQVFSTPQEKLHQKIASRIIAGRAAGHSRQAQEPS